MASRFASFLPPLRGSATVMPWPPWVNTHGYLLASLRDYDHQLTTAPLFGLALDPARSILADRLAAAAAAKRLPDGQIDAVADELHVAIDEQGVDSTRVAAACGDVQ